MSRDEFIGAWTPLTVYDKGVRVTVPVSELPKRWRRPAASEELVLVERKAPGTSGLAFDDDRGQWNWARPAWDEADTTQEAIRAAGFRRCQYHGWVHTKGPNCPRCSTGAMRWMKVI